VLENERAATEFPTPYLSQIIRAMKREPVDAVMMMTGVDVRRVRTARAVHGPIVVQAWCTAGCSNALRVGDPSTVEHHSIGTINLIVAVSEALSTAALAEALQLATEARVAAISSAGIRSVVCGEIATGTGTDCIAVAAPGSRRSVRYCGKHTRLGELVGRAVLESCTAALDEAARPR
jgi:adenosylcobinamide amidohydrolase